MAEGNDANTPKFSVSADGVVLTHPSDVSSSARARYLEAIRASARRLASYLDSTPSNIRNDYRDEVNSYLTQLPTLENDGNVFLADASVQTIRNLLSAEESVLPSAVSARLQSLLSLHAGLRTYYPELERFYNNIAAERLRDTLPVAELKTLRDVIRTHTPEIFDPSVASTLALQLSDSPEGIRSTDVNASALTTALDTLFNIIVSGGHVRNDLRRTISGLSEENERIRSSIDMYKTELRSYRDWAANYASHI